MLQQITGGVFECPPIVIMNELRERNFGTLDGTTLINYNKVCASLLAEYVCAAIHGVLYTALVIVVRNTHLICVRTC
jgi:hypothetical protein